jgi:hypothetical protein
VSPGRFLMCGVLRSVHRFGVVGLDILELLRLVSSQFKDAWNVSTNQYGSSVGPGQFIVLGALLTRLHDAYSPMPSSSSQGENILLQHMRTSHEDVHIPPQMSLPRKCPNRPPRYVAWK